MKKNLTLTNKCLHKIHTYGILNQICLLLIFITTLGNVSFAQTPKMPMGMNIPSLNYYSSGIMFTDMMTTANNFFTFNATGSSPWNTEAIQHIPIDVNGYPTQIPYTPSGMVPQAVRCMINNFYVGKYVVLYDGVGQIRAGGVKNEVVNGKLYIEPNGQGGHIWLDILASQSGNHIRNIRILPVQYETASTYPTFLPEFLNSLRPFHAFRFMDWINTNNSSQKVWSDRITKTYYTQGGERGASIEYAIELCNELNADAWFCVPHQADDNYIRQFARLVRDKLNSNLKIYIEYSNEIWNWQFQQASYVLNNAPGHNNQYVIDGLKAISPNSTNHPEKDAYMMARTFRLWAEEFAAAASSRLVRVAPVQHAWYDNTDRILKYLFQVDKNGCDVISPAGYFSFEKEHHDIWVNMDPTKVTADMVLDAALSDYDTKSGYWTEKTGEIAQRYGVGYVVYEGGQHMQPYMQGDYAYNHAVWDAQIHSKMYDLYMKNFQKHLDPKVNCSLFMAFSLVGERKSKYGSWGHLEHYSQLNQDLRVVAPKYKALLDANTLKGTITTTPTPAPTPSVLRNPENPASTVAGLEYSYFEGNWDALPNFSTLTSVKKGNVSNFDMSVRNSNDYFGFEFKGYINVPTDGSYTFYTNSDDGSKLFIGTTEVINNDGLHAAVEKSGTIGLRAGKHAITVVFFEKTGGEVLNVSYSGPNIAKTLIPASSLFRVSATGAGNGLRAEYFNNIYLTSPASLNRTDATVNFDWGTSSPSSGVNTNHFSARWTGQVEAPISGTYTFSTTSDDGVRLWVNGVQVINNWTDHAPTTNNGTTISLTAGQKYDIRMDYYERGGGAVAKLFWAYPGQTQQVVPQNRLYSSSSNLREDDSYVINNITVAPNPASESIYVMLPFEGEEVSVTLSNSIGEVFLEKTEVVSHSLNVDLSNITPGMYFLTVKKGNLKHVEKVFVTK